MAANDKGYIPYRGILFVVLPIAIGLGFLIYTMKDSPRQIIDKQQCIIDSLEHRVAPLQTRRDTIKQEIVKTQVKWRERLIEAYEEPETIWVEAYVPLMLDSCQEVGKLLAMQVGIGDSLLRTYDSLLIAYKAKDSVCVKAIATKDSLALAYKEKWAQERKNGRIYRVSAIIGSALLGSSLFKK
jgi:hypothetical protein